MEPQPALEPLKSTPPLPPIKNKQVQDEEKEPQPAVQPVHVQVENENSNEDFYPAKIHTEEVDIDKIEHDESLVPDYKEPFYLLWPVVVTNAEENTYHCIDGWSHIEKAKKEDKKTIECDVHCVHTVSDSVLVLKKTAIRMASRSGISRYAEKIRNVKSSLHHLTEFFDKNGKEPYLFYHGGSRRGPGYIQDKKYDIRQLLSDYLSRSRETLNVYIGYGKYVRFDVLEKLIEKEARSRFFQKITKEKNTLIRTLEAEGRSEEEIEEEVSKKVLEWLEQYGPNGDGKKAASQTPDSDDETEESSQESTFKSFSFDGINDLKEEVIELSKDFKEYVADFTLTKDNLAEELPRHINAIEAKVDHIKTFIEEIKRQHNSGTIY